MRLPICNAHFGAKQISEWSLFLAGAITVHIATVVDCHRNASSCLTD